VVHADLQLSRPAGGLSQPLHCMDCRIKSGNDERKKRKNKRNKEAERHQALIRILRVIGRGSHP
jgi:hypothetical protein